MSIVDGTEKSFESATDLDFKCGEDDNYKFICEMQEMFSTIGAPTISHHIKELVNADLIITEKRGKFLVARVNTGTWNEISHIFGKK
jgi:DNA-binding transcriptional ArsR family regulator